MSLTLTLALAKETENQSWAAEVGSNLQPVMSDSSVGKAI